MSVESLVDFSSSIHVSDITVPDNITVLDDPKATVATVSAPREEEPEEVPEMDVDSVEVTGQKSEGEEEASSGESD